MIRSFENQGLEDIYNGINSEAALDLCPKNLWEIAYRKLDQIDSVESLDDLNVSPSNRLELLKGGREGQYSICINDQFRISFNWIDNGPDDM